MEPNFNSSNYYEVLGLTSECEDRDIKIAYRKLAKKYHPDKTKTKESQETFVKISQAYKLLSNPSERKEYDNFIKQKTTNTYTAHDFKVDLEYWADIFENSFREAKGEDVNVFCRVDLEELKSGCKKVITLSSEKISITIKPDTKANSTLKVPGKGNSTEYSSSPGDLFIKLVPKPNKKFKVKENGDIECTEIITYQNLILGGSKVINTLNSKVKIKVPKCTDPSREFRLKKLGLGGSDLILKFKVHVPKKISKSEEAALKSLNSFSNLIV